MLSFAIPFPRHFLGEFEEKLVFLLTCLHKRAAIVCVLLYLCADLQS